MAILHAVADDQRQAVKDIAAAKGDDKGGHLHRGDQRAVDQAKDHANGQTNEYGQRRGDARIQQHALRDADKPDDVAQR